MLRCWYMCDCCVYCLFTLEEGGGSLVRAFLGGVVLCCNVGKCVIVAIVVYAALHS